MHPPPKPNPLPAVRAGHRRRTLRIATDRIETQFGAGNFDDAHEALLDLLRQCCGADGYLVEAEIDIRHANPWFHRYLLHLDDGPADLGLAAGGTAGIADAGYRSFVRKVAELGLEPETD
ncbi:hypothetical protein [Xanthomonas bonasiae]|uniref:hypothetical protein n=1 Tax=Xanthomonas bonasiae TaxID=2810351 RepID=UPI00197FE2FB|nr:hypothetical protein [Xanthomonas bonasiae]MBN6112023.1 hypothetical protein [Xanthomonas bonasiae]